MPILLGAPLSLAPFLNFLCARIAASVSGSKILVSTRLLANFPVLPKCARQNRVDATLPRNHQKDHDVAELIQNFAEFPTEHAFRHKMAPDSRESLAHMLKIGRASCRERVCQYV